MKRLGKIPVPLLPTFVGALTLSNVYKGMGFEGIRHLTMWAATIVLLLYIIKILCFFDTCVNEYKNTVLSSLYGAFPMIMMILGSYYQEVAPILGKGIWLIAIGIHVCHILIFTYRNVIAKRKAETFLPSWFVTYNGIMVSCVVGGAMKEKALLTGIVYYGIIIYFILISCIIIRLLKVEVQDGVYHTLAVVLAPCSLCVVSYINIIENPNKILLFILYGCVLVSLLFVVMKLPRFFSYSFVPGFAGLTFPMAIGIVASQKMAGYFILMGKEGIAHMVNQLVGIQVYLTTMIIGYVLINFIIMAMKIQRK